MAVDKNLFLYDLAVVAMLKNEAPYVKEWLDYHLLAGVNHFYILDNESPDNLKEVLQPYVDAGIVDYIFYHEKYSNYPSIQMGVYNESLKNYRFFCRYIAYIDGDEFLLPKSKPTIPEVLDEILADRKDVGGLAINWQCFGSNFQDKADYSVGVLERFTRRAPSDWHNFEQENFFHGNTHIKTIVNPRRVDFWENPHFPQYFQGLAASNEKGQLIRGFNVNISVEKIAINHYQTKSREEARKRRVYDSESKFEEFFKFADVNEVFDDEILKYRAARLQTNGSTKIDYTRITAALIQNLAPTLAPNVSPEFLTGKMETFLTCRAVSSHLKEISPDKESAKILEEAALNAIQKTLHLALPMAEVQLLIAELPKLLPLDYPAVKDIRKACIEYVPQLKRFWASQLEQMNRYIVWQHWTKWDYILEMLKVSD